MRSATGAAMHVGFWEAFRFWLRLGFISFGGPTGQIAIMHTEVVERRRWISEAQFLHALNYCMLLPGPEAQQLATYIGWLLHRTPGGLVAGAFFVIPSIFILLVLSYVYVSYGVLPEVAAIFYGLKAAVLAIVVHATVRIGRRALRHRALYLVAAAAFSALFFLKIPFPLVIAGAGLIGLLGARRLPVVFASAAHGHADAGANPSGQPAAPTPARMLGVAAVCLAFWAVPMALLWLWRGGADVLFQEAVFFSKAALVTFGGAYAVLPYVAQQAVETHGWLTAAQMIDGLGLAETTPGPLIMVLQFVGFMAGWTHAAELGLAGAVLGALVATYFTFMPCFAWIFLGAPYVERTRGLQWLVGALTAITAAVVGVVLNLAVWFGLHVLLPAGGVDLFALAVGLVAFVGMQRWKWGIVPVVLGAGAVGLLYRVILGGPS